MRWLGRKLLRFAMWGFALFLVAYTGCYFFLNHERLGTFISGRVNKVDRGRFVLKRASYPYFGGLASILFNTEVAVTGADFELYDPDGNLVMKVPGEVHAGAHLQELVGSLAKYAATLKFHLNLHFEHARVDGAYGVIAPLRSSLGKVKPEVNLVAAFGARNPPAQPGAGEFRISVDDVTLEHVWFGLGFFSPTGQVSWSAKLRDASGRAGLVYSSATALASPAGPYFFFKVQPLRTAAGELRLGAYSFALEDVNAIEFGPSGDKREDLIFHASARSRGATLRADGALLSSYSPQPGVRLELELEHGHELLALLPPPLSEWLGGDPRGTLRATGPFTHVALDGDMRDGSAKIQGVEFRELATRLHLESGVLALDPTARVAGGTVAGHLDVGLTAPAWWRARAHLRGVDPKEVPLLPKGAQALFAGKLDAKVRLAGDLADRKEPVSIQVTESTLERAHGGKLPRKLGLTATAEVSPSRIHVKALELTGDGLTLSALGDVDPRSQRLDGSLSVDAHGAAWLAHLGAPAAVEVGQAHVSSTITGTFARPTLSGKLSAAALRYAGRAFDSADANLTFSGGVLKATEVRAAGLGASVQGDAALTLLAASGEVAHPLAEPTLDVHLKADGVSAAALSGWKDLDGRADVSLDVDGPLTNPVGHARLKLPQLSVAGDPYVNGEIDLELGGGGAEIRALKLERRHGGSLSGKGRFGWDGSLRITLAPKGFPIPAIPGVRALPKNFLDGKIGGEVTLVGDVHSPQLDGNLSVFGFSLRDTALGNGSLKWIPGGDATAIAGRFFGDQVSVDGYITLLPKFTVAATVHFTNLELEKLLPEMSKLAEVHGVASGDVRLSIDGAQGLTFAQLRLAKLELTLSSTDEDGRPQKAVLRNQGDVLASSDGKSLRIDRAQLESSLGKLTFLGTIAQRGSDVKIEGSTKLELLEYFFRSAFNHTHGNAYVNLSIKGDLERPELDGTVKLLEQGHFEPRGMDTFFDVPTGQIDFTPTSVSLKNLTLTMEGATAQASGFLEIHKWVPGQIVLDVSGELSAKLLKLWNNDQIAEASGRVKLSVHVGGRWRAPEWQGNAEIRGMVLQLRNFPQEIVVATGKITLNNYDIGLHEVRGTLDDQAISAEGSLSLTEGPKLRQMSLHLEGNELRQSNPDFKLTFSPRVDLSTDANGLLHLDGVIDLNEGTYVQDWGDLKDLVVKPRVVERTPPFWQGNVMLETMTLDLRAKSNALAFKNNLADMTGSATLAITGTLSDPRLEGVIIVDEGGTFNIPGARAPFKVNRSTITFDPDRRIPDETPFLDVSANAELADQYETYHVIMLLLTDTLGHPRIDLKSQEGWDRNDSLFALITGRTPNQLRAQINGTGGAQGAVGGSVGDSLIKSATGYGLGTVISNPIEKTFKLDTAVFEVSAGSVDIRLCKRFGRLLKTCGYGEVGFAGASRAEQSIQLRLSDWVSGTLRIEYVPYLQQGVGTFQDSTTHGKAELKLQVPFLGY